MTLAFQPNYHSLAESSLVGHTIVFTGKLSSLSRREARALVKRLGGVTANKVTVRTTMLVVGEEIFTDENTHSINELSSSGKSNKLKKVEKLNIKSPGHVKVLIEDAFCRLIGLQPNKSLRQRYHSVRQILERYPLIRESQLRHLEAWDLIQPIVRTNTDTYYGFGDVSVIKQINDELEHNNSFRVAVRRLLAAREGQLALSFSAVRNDARHVKVVTLCRRSVSKADVTDTETVGSKPQSNQTAIAIKFFLEGSELDEGSEADRERACTAYRKALLLDPCLVPAIVNLANLHYANDELIEAQALYGRALSLDPECFEAFFNLGNIHHDLGRYDEAISYYADVLRLHSTYVDAHFYMAVTLEKMGRSTDAKTHWRAYQQLAPNGEWVELAKEFSE